jgi:hypothetical protein
MVDSCPPQFNGEDIYRMLHHNFKKHYQTNKAPLGLYFHSTWFKRQEYFDAFVRFVDDLQKMPDVYFVTNYQAIEWMKTPTPTNQLAQFEPWQCKQRQFDAKELACNLPSTCRLHSRVLQQDRYLNTCNECPSQYPWIRNEFGLD